MAVCIAVLGKDNSPLFVTCTSPDQELNFHYLVHTALDYIEERLSLATSDPSDNTAQSASLPLYLGFLYSTEEYKIYGYVTNTKIKFVIVIDAGHNVLRDNDIRSLFRQLHGAYADVICNPFFPHGEPIKSKKFGDLVHGMLVKV